MTELGKGKQRHFFPPGETPSGQKRCSQCCEIKPMDAFYWVKPFWRDDGILVGSYCKECQRKRSLKKHYENPEEATRRSKEHWQRVKADPTLHQAQLDGVRAANKKRLASDPAFRDEIALNTRNRRARLAGAEGRLSVGEWAAIREAYCSACLCCLRSDVSMSIDHCQLVQHGGANNAGNVEPLCRECNAAFNHASHDLRKGVAALVFHEVFAPWAGACVHVPGLRLVAA